MRDRIERLEEQADQKDKDHATEVRELERQQELKTRLYEAQQALDRHRINNLNTAFQALLLLLRKGINVSEAVEEVEKMRSEHLAREAEESALIRAAAIKAGVEPAP